MMVRTTRRFLFVLGSAVIALSDAVACSDAGVPASPQSPGYDGLGQNAAFDDAADGEPDAGPDVVEAGCPQDLPGSCPSPVPSFMSDVEPIINLRCGPCHGVGGVEQSKFDFSTYQGVHQNFGPILNALGSCLMPPPDAAAPTLAERETLLAWLVCTAPNN